MTRPIMAMLLLTVAACAPQPAPEPAHAPATSAPTPAPAPATSPTAAADERLTLERRLRELEAAPGGSFGERLRLRAALHPMRPDGKARVFELDPPLMKRDGLLDEDERRQRARAGLIARPIEELERLVGDTLHVGDLILTGDWDFYRGVDALMIGEELTDAGLRLVLIDPFRGEFFVTPPTYLAYPTRVVRLDCWDDYRVEAVPLDPEWLGERTSITIDGTTYASRPRTSFGDGREGKPLDRRHYVPGARYLYTDDRELDTLESGWGAR